MTAPSGHNRSPIVVVRNRVPHITLIKRAAGRTAFWDAVMFFAGASTAVFTALLALVIAKFHPFR
jgi:hypothetical protein